MRKQHQQQVETPAAGLSNIDKHQPAEDPAKIQAEIQEKLRQLGLGPGSARVICGKRTQSGR